MGRRCESLLGSLGLSEHMHKRPEQMSGGQRQRVAIARALANNPQVILADEPTGNLDTASSRQVLEIFRKLVDETGRAVVIVTHDMGLAAEADRHVSIVDGKLVAP
jgi:lipoprotein-releasing system ATP-binding protein